MAIAPTLASHLERAGIQPEILTHPRTPSASRTAEASHVSGDRVAKAIMLSTPFAWEPSDPTKSDNALSVPHVQLWYGRPYLSSRHETFTGVKLGRTPNLECVPLLTL
jgi:hypothetical protein